MLLYKRCINLTREYARQMRGASLRMHVQMQVCGIFIDCGRDSEPLESLGLIPQIDSCDSWLPNKGIERLHLRHNHDVKQLLCGKMYTHCNGVSSTFCCSSAVCYFFDTNFIRLIVRWLGKTIMKDN